MSIMPLYLIVWSLQKGSPLKMTASTLKNFRLSKILLVKIYNYCNRANIHRGMVFLLLFQKHKWFPAAGAASEKNQPVSVICQWTSELSPYMQDEGFRVTVKGPNSAYEPTWQKMYFLTYITSHFQTLKKAAYESGWCFRLFTAQQACNNLLRKYDPDRREKNPTLLSCIEIHTDIGWKLLLCSNI